MTIVFGTEPTEKPPPDGTWMWAGDRWLPVITDSGDGIPESLDLGDSDDEE